MEGIASSRSGATTVPGAPSPAAKPVPPVLADDLLDRLFDGVYFVDRQRHITYWNSGAERISGFARQEVTGSCCSDNLLRHVDGDGRELCRDGCPLAAAVDDGHPRDAGAFLHHKLGHRVPVSVRVSPIRDHGGEIVGAVEIFCDNSTPQQILEEYEKLKQEVYLDRLTGVGNRSYGEMVLGTRIFDLQQHGIPFGVLFMDIDHFKEVNDRYGHPVGDRVLAMAARTISTSLRKIDVVVRWGGEEFVVILPGATATVAQAVAERVRILVQTSFISVAGASLNVTVSIGAAMARPDDTSATVVSRADALMYRSKQQGRNRVSAEVEDRR